MTPTTGRQGWRIKSEPDRLVPAGLRVFTDLFHLIHSLEHDYKEEKGQEVLMKLQKNERPLELATSA